jgi:hypothetical protein
MTELFGQVIGFPQVRGQEDSVTFGFSVQFYFDWLQKRLIGFRINLGFQLQAGTAHNPSNKRIVLMNKAGKKLQEPGAIRFS